MTTQKDLVKKENESLFHFNVLNASELKSIHMAHSTGLYLLPVVPWDSDQLSNKYINLNISHLISSTNSPLGCLGERDDKIIFTSKAANWEKDPSNISCSWSLSL